MQWKQKRDIINDMIKDALIRDKDLTFKDLSVGKVFHMNGTLWQKRSKRTAHVFGMPHRWFYFSGNDIVDT